MQLSGVVRTFCLVIINVGWLHSAPEKDIYLATTHSEALIDKHETFMNMLETLIENEEIQLEMLKGYLRRHKMESYWKALSPNYMEHPLNAFTVIKRLSTDLNEIKEIFESQIENAKEFVDSIESSADSLPKEEDLYGAVLAVRRIQATYNLGAKELSEGQIDYKGEVYLSHPMSASDCFEMGRILYKTADFYGAKPWIERAIRKDKLETVGDNYEYYKSFLDVINEQLNTDESLEEYKVWDVDTWNRQTALCRNEYEIARNISKRFTCYLTRNNPFLLLAPIKTEQLYTDPDIFIYHDVISDYEIEHLKGLSNPKLERAEDIENTTDATAIKNTASYRTCKHMWVTDEMSDVAVRISQRINDLTGLNMEKAEDLQIANYGIGGHYDAHFDFDQKDEDQTLSSEGRGNRLTTVLFYMSDVTEGGATVFINLGLSVFPIKNAALVWTNLLPSGEGDLNTVHAACPVLVGSKWTATKWLHQVGQEFIRPCNLEYQREEDVRPVPTPVLRIRAD